MELLKKLITGTDLSPSEAAEAMEGMMSGKFSAAQAAALLVALKIKGESAGEITEFARVMRKNAILIHPKAEMLVDTCGTGGDSSHTFNISTTAAIIASAAGASVAKHGNRSVSSKCGSADVLESLGVKIIPEPARVQECIEKTGFGFMFAPNFHPAMKNIAPVRAELGIRTVFNILGPLTNPASAPSQLLGAFDLPTAAKMATVLLQLGTRHALVVHSEGMDEIGLGKTQVHEVKNGRVEIFPLDAADFGFEKRMIPTVQSREESAQIVLGVLKCEAGAARDISILNAAAALYVSGKSGSIEHGIALAQKAIDSGAALAKLEQIRKFTGEK
jgi:anthranilate phosphoribosyltransferase